ncbi:MAG TPA: hypothetical protein VKR58_01170, partial [Aquella sp.]|nr:hypothetical protein [Aquella sp.]
DRDKLIVILAGYTMEMQDFIECNPGFKSRFNRYIEFSDYTSTELFSIFKGLCSNLEYKISDDAAARLATLFENALTNRDKSFGNGRFVRNIFEKTLEKQANRLSTITSLDKEILTLLTVDDIPNM